MKLQKLDIIRAPQEELDEIEARIKALFKKEIYLPLMAVLGAPGAALQNAGDLSGFDKALSQGKVTFNRGTFSGRFNAETSRMLKRLGAKWDRRTQTFKLSFEEMPPEIQTKVRSSASSFQRVLDSIDAKLADVVPEELAKRLDVSKLFDRSVWRVHKEFEDNVRGLVVSPKLTDEQAARISNEWQENLRLYVRNFTDEEILKLRGQVRKTVEAGNRYGSLVGTIQRSFGVSANKAEFLAQQETKLLTSKFQETRYAAVGVDEYSWHHVVGSEEHPVRPRHYALGEASKAGKLYRWDQPPVTTEPGQPERRNNPGQDFNCRCGAIPIVRFKQ